MGRAKQFTHAFARGDNVLHYLPAGADPELGLV